MGIRVGYMEMTSSQLGGGVGFCDGEQFLGVCCVMGKPDSLAEEEFTGEPCYPQGLTVPQSHHSFFFIMYFFFSQKSITISPITAICLFLFLPIKHNK